MSMFAALTKALVSGRRAQLQGAAVGRQERAAAEQAARTASAEAESALQKALVDQQRADNDTRRTDVDVAKGARDAERATYEQTQRRTGEQLQQALLEERRAQTARARRAPAGGGGAGSAGTKPLSDSGQRSGRNELVRDAVRAEALQRNVDLSQATPEQRRTLAALAMQRVQQSPELLSQAKRYGVRYLDYLSEANGGRGSSGLDGTLQSLERTLGELNAPR